MRRNLLATAIAAVVVMTGLGYTSAQATPTVSGGPVTATQFLADGITSGTFTYLSSDPVAFTGGGSATLILASSTYYDTFGYTNAAYGNAKQVFSNAQSAPVSATINPAYSPFVFYFATSGGGFDAAATLYSNGTNAGTDYGQANLAVYKSTTGEYAFFFDDGGPSGSMCYCGYCMPNDDNDYNDLVVTYTPSPVLEPASLTVLASGILGLGIVSRRRRIA